MAIWSGSLNVILERRLAGVNGRREEVRLGRGHRVESSLQQVRAHHVVAEHGDGMDDALPQLRQPIVK